MFSRSIAHSFLSVREVDSRKCKRGWLHGEPSGSLLDWVFVTSLCKTLSLQVSVSIIMTKAAILSLCLLWCTWWTAKTTKSSRLYFMIYFAWRIYNGEIVRVRQHCILLCAVLRVVWFRSTRPIWVPLHTYPYNMRPYGISLQYTKIRKGGVFCPSQVTFQTSLVYKCPLINPIPLLFSLSTNNNIIIYIRLLIY